MAVCLAFMEKNDQPKINIITLDEVRSTQGDSSKVFYGLSGSNHSYWFKRC